MPAKGQRVPQDRLRDVMRSRERDEEWVQDVAAFLVALEGAVYSGQVSMPLGLLRALAIVIRGGIPRRP